MPEFQINYLALCVSAFATIFIGALWYSPLLFGKSWLKAHGYTSDQMRASVGRNFLVSLICYLVMAFVIAILADYMDISTFQHGALLGFLVWIGFLASMGMTAHLVSGNSWTIYIIDTAYQLVYAVIMGGIIGFWN